MRVRFLVDGLNLYHSVRSAERHLPGRALRWLDIRAMCQTLVNSSLGPGNTLQVRAVRLSFPTYEEKETDVAIACKLLQLLAEGQGDGAHQFPSVMVTGTGTRIVKPATW